MAVLSPLLSLPVLSCLFHALRTPRLIASCSVCLCTQFGVVSVLSSVFSSSSSALFQCCKPSLCAQVAIIADLTPNSQLASMRCSVLIIYQLPQHLQLMLDRWAPALFLLSPTLKKKCNVDRSQLFGGVLWLEFKAWCIVVGLLMSSHHVLSVLRRVITTASPHHGCETVTQGMRKS